MEVENYTQNLSDYSQFRNDGRGGYGIKKAPGSISKRAYDRLLREATALLDGYGIDFTQFGDPVVIFHDMLTAQVEWTHKASGNKLCLSEICLDKQTGAIHQSGTSYGVLTL